jgi:emp24/gp25L/p24 family/GOLD
LSDSIMGRVMRWTLFEAATLMLIALGQVLYLRKFMETRRYL